MNKNTPLVLVAAILLSACGTRVAPPTATPVPPTATPIPPTITPAPTLPPLPTVTPVCVAPAPTQADIDRALSYTGQTFSGVDWRVSQQVADTSVDVTWRNDTANAIVYLQALIFPCGYEEPELNAYFSGQNWQAIFAAYSSYQPVAECRNDAGLRLYQFTASLGSDYAVSYWVQNDGDNRVIATMLVFPAEQLAEAGVYAAQLFPSLPNCS